MARTPPQAVVGINTHGLYGAVPPQLSGQIYTTNNTSGQFLTSTGTNGVTWSDNTNTVMRVNQSNPPGVDVKGRMVINGRDLEDRLDTIEKVLQIPERDVILEKKHPKLQKMYYDYINELAKYRMWHAIKGDEDGTT